MLFLSLALVAFVAFAILGAVMHGFVVTSERVSIDWPKLLLWSAILAVLFAAVASSLLGFGSATWKWFVTPAPPSAWGAA